MKLVIALLSVIVGVVTAQNASALDLTPIVNLGDYSKLLESLSATGADSVIAENVPVTILGPYDGAFDSISPLLDDLTNEELKQILLDHVIVGKIYTSENLENEGGCVVATTAGGTKVSLYLDPIGEMDVDSIHVVDKDVVGDFGVFLGIEQVILPGEHTFLECSEPLPADLSPIEDLGNYNTFLNALNQTGLGSIIRYNVVAIFAPTDEALAAVDLSGLSNDELSDILKNHFLAYSSQDIRSFDVLDNGCKEGTTLSGRKIAMRYNETTGVFSINGIPLNADLDISGSDFGTMHGLTGVLTEESQYVTCFDVSPIADAGKYNTFIEALTKTKVNEAIGEIAPVTIFGPTDAALAAAQDTIADLTEEELTQVLKNHVIYSEIDYQQIAFDGCIEGFTILDTRVAIRYDIGTDTITVNGIPIVDTDIVSKSFGVFHGIEGLLTDGTYAPCLDFSPILAAGNYSTFVSLLRESAATALINLFNPVTILAPTDSALAAIDPSLLTPELISNHVIYSNELLAAEVISAGCVNLQSDEMYIDIRYDSKTGKGTVNGIPIVSYDTEVAFGVMHGLDGVLINGVTPFTPCADFSPIEQASNYGAFMSVLEQTEQNKFISSLSPVTFFGPTDSAFAAAENRLDGLSENDLIALLGSHIITFPANLTVEQVKFVGCFETYTYGSLVLEVSIRYDEMSDTMAINGIPVIESIFGNYGVMHGISGILGIDGNYEPCPLADDDGPINPPEGPTYNIFDELTEAFEKPIIDAMLAADETTLTFFGPTDEAFGKLDETETESQILQVYKGHIVAGTVKSEQIEAEGCVILDTLAGTKIRAMMNNGTVLINDSKVVLADQRLDGFILFHGLDKVILPGSFEDCPAKTTSPTPAPVSAPNTTSGGFAAGLGIVCGCVIALLAL